ncbi:MAG: hypothetical protein FJZ00_14640 [Candidatus Sericytochromatia bacterium]|uniref:Uncharacterized protein n=1 Tax=Candidatus Tanganyikabacteria bacterium TaxID=2961651 RepID=A0A937X933_9BACT|nr:hypothetical protein [Candidatus Tanganyikabacteria bacterium]
MKDRQLPDADEGVVVPFAPKSSAASRRRAPAPIRTAPQGRETVEDLLSTLRGRREKLQERLGLLGLAIDKLEDQVATKRQLSVMPGAVS